MGSNLVGSAVAPHPHPAQVSGGADPLLRSVVGWTKAKFGIDLDLEEVKSRDAAALKRFVREKVMEAYDQKEAEYPVMAALYEYGRGGSLNREALVAWASERFDSDVDVELLKNKQRDEIRASLVELSKRNKHKVEQALAEVQKRLDKLSARPRESRRRGPPAGATGNSIPFRIGWPIR